MSEKNEHPLGDIDTKEVMKQAACMLRKTAEERDKNADELKKTAEENSGLKSKIHAYELACKLAAEGEIDSTDISEKVDAIIKLGAEKPKEELELARLVNSGLGNIKQASIDIGDADPLTEFLMSNQGG